MMDQLVGGNTQDERDKGQNENDTSYPDSPEGANMLSSGGDGMAGMDGEPYEDGEEGMDEDDADDDAGDMDDGEDEGMDGDGQDEADDMGGQIGEDMGGMNPGDMAGAGGQMDYEQMDLRICGDLIEKNKKLDEFFMSQNLDG